MECRRPDGLASPIIWDRFEGNPHGDQPPLKYTIQQITEDMIEEAVEHMTRYFLVRELLTGSIGYLEDKVSTEEMRDLWRNALKQGNGLVALVEDEDVESKRVMAGMNITLIVTLEEKEKGRKEFEEKYKGKLYKRTLRALLDLEKDVDISSLYGVTKYLAAYGLSVAPQYNGDGVGYHLLKARVPLCRALGIGLTVTTFSSPAVQHVAKKAGFETIASLEYQSYKQNGKVAFPRLDGPCLLMAKRIPSSGD